MSKIKVGVLCPSEIAFRRFMPALRLVQEFEYIGIAAATQREFSGENNDEVKPSELEKAENFVKEYGGKIYHGYEKLITSDDIDAIYIPLPPALHYRWAKLALENGKHVLLEKPFTISLDNTEELITIARENGLALHENYMFMYHSQLDWIKNKILEGTIGDIRLIRIDFGFPFRGANDFRYDKKLGGGALWDCGGYTLKLASYFLGDTARVTSSQLNRKEGLDVDIYGSATLVNEDGLTAQVSFGMDNSYKCSLEIWGSIGSIYTNRILTAPAGFEPTIIIKNGNEEQSFLLPADDTFRKSIEHFEKCIKLLCFREMQYQSILFQGEMMDRVK